MTLVALAADTTPHALLAACAPTLTGRAEPRSEQLGAWSVVTDGPPARAGSWTAVGRPVADPWGLPGEPERDGAALQTLATDLERWGPAAIQLAAGPVVAFRDDGMIVRALNGLIPVFAAVTGCVVSTDEALVRRLTSGEVHRIPPGHLVDPAVGVRNIVDALVPDPLVHRPSRTAGSALERRVRALGASGRLHELPEELVSLVDGTTVIARLHTLGEGSDVLWAPDQGVLDDLERLAVVRDQVGPNVWRRFDSVGHRVVAPWLERPALDLATAGALS
jgi:hypothetical protein